MSCYLGQRVTAVPANPRVSELRDLFRHLTDFRATYESTGLEEITTPQGHSWSLWDLEYLYEQVMTRLRLRQQQAITLCLVHGVKESDAAEMMGVSRTNPVMMYASLGIQRLLDMIDEGLLDRFALARKQADELSRTGSLLTLAEEIRTKVLDINGCWLYPNPGSRPPRLLLRSVQSYTGYIAVSPMQVLWAAHVGPIPEGCRLEHSTRFPRVSIACVNHGHGELIQSPQRQARMQLLASRYIQSRQGVA